MRKLEQERKKVEQKRDDLQVVYSNAQKTLENLYDGFTGEEFNRFYNRSIEESDYNKNLYEQSLAQQEDMLCAESKKVSQELAQSDAEDTGSQQEGDGADGTDYSDK